MNWIGIVILLILGFTTYRAYRSGFIRELVSLSATILAVPLAGIFYGDLFPKVQPIVDNEPLAYLISFVAILAGVIVAGHIIAHLLKSGVAALNFGASDKVAGAAFGLLKGVLVSQAILLALVLFPSPDFRDDIEASPVARTLLNATPVILAILPDSFDEGLQQFRDSASALGNFPLTGVPGTTR
jgi:membrane protein required for colicin V production